MTWTNIPDSVFSSGKPGRALDMRNIRDNIVAAFDGDDGAPKLSPNAVTDGTIPAAKLVANSITATQIGPGAVDSPGIAAGAVDNTHIATATIGAEKFQSGPQEVSWVAERFSDLAVGAIGSIAFLSQSTSSSTNIVRGSIYSGSSLDYFGVLDSGSNTNESGPSGSWMALGSVTSSGTNAKRATIFLRVA